MLACCCCLLARSLARLLLLLLLLLLLGACGLRRVAAAAGWWCQAEVTDYSQPDALRQLVAIDVAYLGAIAAANFAFPYILLPVAFNPAQLLVLPAESSSPPPKPK